MSKKETKKETKRERFVRIAEKRVQSVMDTIFVLSKCSDQAVYEYTLDDVNKICLAILECLNDCRRSLLLQDRFRLKPPKSDEDVFEEILPWW